MGGTLPYFLAKHSSEKFCESGWPHPGSEPGFGGWPVSLASPTHIFSQHPPPVSSLSLSCYNPGGFVLFPLFLDSNQNIGVLFIYSYFRELFAPP